MLTEDEFYEKWGKFFRKHNYQGKVQYPEEDEGDKVALIVIDDTPVEVTRNSSHTFLCTSLKVSSGYQ
jgi:hypothetical protein